MNKRAILLIFVLISSALAYVSTPVQAAAKKPKKAAKVVIAAGKPCTPLGAHAANTNLDCVTVGKGLQWQVLGSRLNPVPVGTPAEYSVYTDPVNRYRLRIVSVTPNATAQVIPDPRRPPIPAGSQAVMIAAELTFLGDGEVGDPQSKAGYSLVDPADHSFGLYADQACDEFGMPPNPLSLRNAPLNQTQQANLCAVVPDSSAATALLFHVRSPFTNLDIWFKTQ
jgi:hypothetical protein